MKIIYPFSPIIWEKDKYIKPHILSHNEYEKFNNIYLVNFGTLSQVYFSLFLFEFYKKKYPDKKLYFIGNPDYYELIKWQGIASVVDEHNLSPELLKKYPCPIFQDLDNNIFYNPLFQISFYTDELGIPVKKNKSNLEYCILENLCIDNYKLYKPCFRLFPEPKEYDISFNNWLNLNKYILQENPIIVYLPKVHNINYNFSYILTSLLVLNKKMVCLKETKTDFNIKSNINYSLYRLIYLLSNYDKLITNHFSLYWVFFILRKTPITCLKENIFAKKNATEFCNKFDIDMTRCNFKFHFRSNEMINFYKEV